MAEMLLGLCQDESGLLRKIKCVRVLGVGVLLPAIVGGTCANELLWLALMRIDRPAGVCFIAGSEWVWRG